MERKSWWRIVLLSLLFCALSVAALAESYSTLRYLDNGQRGAESPAGAESAGI